MFKIGLCILFFIININYIFSLDNCSISNPNRIEDCFYRQNYVLYSDYCCYFNSSDKSFCKAIPYSSYNDKDKYENIDGVLYQVTCDTGNRKVTLLEECGNTNEANEANYEKCKKHSTVLNSCCYVKGNGNINKGCYWLGTKYEGDISWAGVEMECSMDYLKYSIIYLIFIFLFF